MDPWLKLFFRSMNFWTVISWASVHFVVQGFSGFWVGGSEILKCDHCCCSLLWTLHIAFDSVNERPRTERFHELILLHVAWVTETFHARFPAYLWPTPKHPATREKRPCVLSWTIRITLFHFQHIILKLGTLFHYTNTEIKWNFVVVGREMVH